MPPARMARAGLALAAALLVAGGIAGCGQSDNPNYQTGYQAGLTAHQKLISQHGSAIGDLPWLCAVAAYKDIQAMSNSTALQWQDGFDVGCTGSAT